MKTKKIIPGQLLTGLGCLVVMAMVSIPWGCAHTGAIPPNPTFKKSQKAAVFSDKQINESSGLAMSHRRKDLLWTHNDSGGSPTLFAVTTSGTHLGQVDLFPAENVDWEDMASFQWKGDPWLLVADTGDNRARRKTCTLYIIPEPVPAGDGQFTGSIRPTRQIVFQYEDGPRDCEAVAVDVAHGRCLLLTKRDTPPRLYAVPLFEPAPQPMATAVYIASLPTIPPPTLEDLMQPYGDCRSQPTAMDLTADGSFLVVLTYKNAYLFKPSLHQTWKACLAAPPEILKLPSPALGVLVQREAICFSADGNTLYLTSEQLPSPLFRMDKNP